MEVLWTGGHLAYSCMNFFSARHHSKVLGIGQHCSM
uniref:Uncharacterized protein n=1 Tax=Arundo donax TaxID=35708 RepID=A0A0A9DXP5_ARUDO